MKTLFEHSLIAAPGDALPRPHGNCYWVVTGRVLAGEYPGADNASVMERRLRALLDAGVSRAFDLTHEGEALPEYASAWARIAAERGVHVRTQRFSVADFGVPSELGMRSTLNAIDAALAEGSNLYLHCRAGIGRTGTVVGCLLVEQGFQAEQALDLIRSKRQVVAKLGAAPHSPETRAQREFIERWALRSGAA